MLSKKLFGVAIYIEGIDYGGQAEFTPPNIAATVEESNMPGHGGAFDIATGRLEKMDAEVSVMDITPALSGLAANPNSINTSVEFRCAATDGAENRSERWTLRGLWREQNRDKVGADDNNVSVNYIISVRVLTHFVDGVERRHIDLPQRIHRVDGNDVNAELSRLLRG